jgi:hypothetical protein
MSWKCCWQGQPLICTAFEIEKGGAFAPPFLFLGLALPQQ